MRFPWQRSHTIGGITEETRRGQEKKGRWIRRFQDSFRSYQGQQRSSFRGYNGHPRVVQSDLHINAGLDKDNVMLNKHDVVTWHSHAGRLDKHDGRLDKQDGRLDKQDGQLDKQDGRLIKQSGRLDKHDGRLDKQDGRLNNQHGRLDTHDGRLDKPDYRLDKQEGRLDKHGGRLNTHDGRLDTHDGRLDKHDGRLDKNDGRLYKYGGRLDKHDCQLDKHDGRLDKDSAMLAEPSVFVDMTNGPRHVTRDIPGRVTRDRKREAVCSVTLLNMHTSCLEQPVCVAPDCLVPGCLQQFRVLPSNRSAPSETTGHPLISVNFINLCYLLLVHDLLINLIQLTGSPNSILYINDNDQKQSYLSHLLYKIVLKIWRNYAVTR